MLTILFLTMSLLIGGAFAIILSIQRRNVALFRSLSELRRNSVEYYRTQLKDRTSTHLAIAKEVDDVITIFQRFFQRYHNSQQDSQHDPSDLESDLAKVRSINEDLVDEFAILLQQHHGMEEKYLDLQLTDEKLRERNQELEYAINLESISMLETYQEQGKLFTAIDDVRRSLTRILNPA